MRDQREYKANQLVESISKQLDLTEEEMNEKLLNGHSRLYNRVTWANSYMKHANLIERTDRGIYKITQQGLDTLAENPQKIDLKYLYKFSVFTEWYGKRYHEDVRSSAKLENYESELENDSISNKTPIDLIEKGRAELENELQYDLLEKVKSLADGGKVLIPIPAVGRAQELMMVIDHYMKLGQMIEAPVFTEGMISEASAIHESYPEYLARELRQKILETDDNPFDSEYFTNIEHADAREEPMRADSPCIILATSGMLEGGPVLEYFKNIAPDTKNKLLFVSYQVNGTMGRRVLDHTVAHFQVLLVLFQLNL